MFQKTEKLVYDLTKHHIRSFVTRIKRLSKAQAQALKNLGPQFLLPYKEQLLNLNYIFKRQAPIIFEIGFGMGEASAEIALAMSNINFIGVEVYKPGVGNLLKLISEKQLDNLLLLQHDAVDVLIHMIPLESLTGIHIFFPDPWHKARHNKRRLIQRSMVALLASRLTSGGYIHCATDWQDYAEYMLNIFNAEPTLKNSTYNYVERPSYRPITKFEHRGILLGHRLWDLIFFKTLI